MRACNPKDFDSIDSGKTGRRSNLLSITTNKGRGDIIGVMEQLEALGASAILETQINNCRL